MGSISLRLPGYLHDKVRESAEREKVSINQFITLALAERAARGSREKFERALAKVADVEALGRDAL